MARILGVDHATKHAGIALFDSERMVDHPDMAFVSYEAIDLGKSDDSPMSAMHQIVKRWIFENKPDIIALEKPMDLRNGDTSRKLIEVYAACKLACEQAQIEIMEIGPSTSKLHMTGNGSSDKEDVARALEVRFDLPFDEIAVPVYYKVKRLKGKIKERMYDISDACALCVAAAEIKMREVVV